MTPNADGPTGVLLLNMGGPDSLDAVEPFLFNLFNDNDIIPLPARGFLLQRPLAWLISSRRARFVRGYYEKIGLLPPEPGAAAVPPPPGPMNAPSETRSGAKRRRNRGAA